MREKTISGMMVEARKSSNTIVERMKENSELKKRISQLEDEVIRLRQKHDSYCDIGVQTMEPRLLPVSGMCIHNCMCLYCLILKVGRKSSRTDFSECYLFQIIRIFIVFLFVHFLSFRDTTTVSQGIQITTILPLTMAKNTIRYVAVTHSFSIHHMQLYI